MLAAYHLARDDQTHDFIGPLENLMHAKIAHQFLDAIIRKVAVAAEHLQRLVGDIEAGATALRRGWTPQDSGGAGFRIMGKMEIFLFRNENLC